MINLQKNTDKNEISSDVYRILVFSILLISAVIRFYKIHLKGLIYWDEGIFIQGAKFVHWRVFWLQKELFFSDGPVLNPMLADLYQGLPVFLQKPIHVILLSGWTFFTGNSPTAATVFSAICGVMTVFLTIQLGKMWFNRTIGCAAGIWLALQPYHIHYSRLALHEIDSMFLFLLTVFAFEKVYLSTSRFMAFFSGVLAAATLATSYRYLPFLMIITLYYGCLLFTQKKEKLKVITIFISTALGMISVLVLLEWIYRVMFNPYFLWSQPDSYLAVLKMKFLGSESSFDFNHTGYYFEMVKQFDGWIALILILCSITYLLFRRSRQTTLLLLLIIGPWILFSLTTTRVPRTITGILPFIALAAGLLFCSFLNYTQRKKYGILTWSGLIIVILLAASFFFNMQSILQLKSGYPEVVEWLEKQDDSRHMSTMPPVYSVYQGRFKVIPVPFNLNDIHGIVEETHIRFLTVDWQKFLRYSRGVLEIEKKCLPVFAVPHNPGTFFASLRENHLPQDFEDLSKDPSLGYLKVYDLYKVLPELGYRLSFLETFNE